jgi:hypothetical protein
MDDIEATVRTGGNHGGCGVGFEEGETYAVFAWPADERANQGKVSETTYGGASSEARPTRGAVLDTSICSLTAPLRSLRPHMTMIRNFRTGKPEPLIYGRISEFGYEFDGWYFDKYFGPMRGIEVVANGMGKRLTTRTDEDGSFMFEGLETGEYAISAQLPESHQLQHHSQAGAPVTLKSNEEAAELFMMTQLVNRLGGTLVTASGARPKTQIQLSLIRLASANKPVAEVESRGTFAEEGGRFLFEAVPPGKYIMGISAVDVPAQNTPYPKTYYPSGDRVDQAQVFEVKTPTVTTDLEFILPAELETTQLRGMAVDARGRPVTGATVNLSDIQQPARRVFGFTGVKTDAAGRFEIVGFKGRRYLLHAYRATEFFERKGVQSRPVEVTFGREAKPVKLVLDQAGTGPSQLK